ncbi:Glutamate receptor 2.4 [Morella rubra]|uniref:Glutamate receptor 2.4 n=1 Tax=Morella rubra TaxID=262757 RepID=A0A6A1W5F2_9ROSI|nr:Glutamate receptor 2.4 [Morella rubra]
MEKTERQIQRGDFEAAAILVGGVIVDLNASGPIQSRLNPNPNFYAQFSNNFRAEYLEEANPTPGIDALRAYDSIMAISKATERTNVRIVNVPGKRYKQGDQLNNRYEEIEFWTSEDGFSEGLVEEKSREKTAQGLSGPVIWPGTVLKRITPKGWAMPTEENPLIIGVPSDTSFPKFVKDHFDLDYTRHEDVRTVVETMMTARRTHRNRMHAYFKKFPSKEAALLKRTLIPQKNSGRSYAICSPAKHLCEQNKKNRSKLTVNHAAGSHSFQRTRACMKNQESGNINPAELYKKNYTNKDGIWTSEGAREI